MLDVDRVLRQDRWMRAMTGLNLQAFARLLVSFSMASEAAEQQDLTPRQRARGGGRKLRILAASAPYSRKLRHPNLIFSAADSQKLRQV